MHIANYCIAGNFRKTLISIISKIIIYFEIKIFKYFRDIYCCIISRLLTACLLWFDCPPGTAAYKARRDLPAPSIYEEYCL